MSRKIYDVIKKNIKSIEVGSKFKTRTQLLLELGLENYQHVKTFDYYLSLVCDYTVLQTIKGGNKQYIINQIYDLPIPYVHGGYIEDEAFLINYVNGKGAGVYVIYAYDDNNKLYTYVGSSIRLRERYLKHKFNVTHGNVTSGAEVLAMKGAKVDWVYLADEGITEERLRKIEETEIYFFKKTKRGLSNHKVDYQYNGGIEAGIINWDLRFKLGVFLPPNINVVA